jgi:general secretion pathway protein A
MNYYELLGIRQEPFSTSPDPDFFFRSREHLECLQRLEIGIRLRRGLSIILGSVGTGKTTLSRILLQQFQREKDRFLFHLILDPDFGSEFEFLTGLVRLFGLNPEGRSTLEYKNAIQNYLYSKGVDEDKTIVLLIDEGQKLTPTYIEVLRTLLNYETNEFKLLQLVILAQLEFLPRIRRMKNFMDRITMSYMLNPLNETDTKEMIEFRLKQAGLNSDRRLFTEGAYRLIYLHTQGFPRKVTKLCHNALITTLTKQNQVVDETIIQSLIDKDLV